MKTVFKAFFVAALVYSLSAHADSPAAGDSVPVFSLKTQDGADFSIADRRGKGWTVLYFYPKADTPGCTAQACAFRDSINKIKDLNAAVYGISADTVEDQKRFHTKHRLSFDVLADPDASVIKLFDAKMPILGIAKRWTFLIDPDLKIRWVEKDVDPMLDAQRVADKLSELQKEALK